MSNNLYSRTSRPSFLLKMILAIIMAGVSITSIVNMVSSSSNDSQIEKINLISEQNDFNKDSIPEKIQTYFDNKTINDKEWVEITFFLCNSLDANLRNILSLLFISQEHETIKLCGYLLGSYEVVNHSYAEILKNKASILHPKRFHCKIYFYYLNSIKEEKEALNYLFKECSFKDANDERDQLLNLAYHSKSKDLLQKALENDSFSKHHVEIGVFLSALNKDYLNLLKYVYLDLLDVQFDGIFFITVILGLVWLAIWIHAANPPKILSGTTALCISGFTLGILSTAFTVFIIYIMDIIGPFTEGNTAVSGLSYYIIAVGFKEEFIKLLFILPLIPILLKRQDTLEWLLVPACVGLGFAVEENLNYFIYSDARAATGRFFTANFLHVALTALAGESLIYLFYYKGKTLSTFIQTFGMIVLIHGLYDAFIAVPALNLPFLSFVALILLAKFYFTRLQNIRKNPIESISLTTHFIFGICISTMSLYIYHGTYGGHIYAIRSVLPSLLDLAIIIYMFLYYMPNSIIKLHN